jgi:VWFA-related protein
MRRELTLPLVLPLMLGAFVVAAQEPQRPVFRAGTEVVLVDAQVVTRDGHPIVDLAPADFEVQIGGQKRRVVSADFIRYDAAAPSGAPDARVTTAAPPEAVDASVRSRRLYILAVDESSFSTLAAMAWKEAIKRFIERLDPGDVAGLYAYPMGGSLVQLTRDHAAVLAGADGIVGRLDPPVLRYHMSLSEMSDITRGDRFVAERVAERECARPQLFWCRDFDIPREALAFAHEVELRMAQSIGGLRTLMRSVGGVAGRKTVVVVSGGLFAADQVGARGDVSDLISAVGQEAARANINLYVLHLDRNFIEQFSARGRALPTVFRDAELLGLGLDRFAGIAGGELIRVQAGSGDYAFDRVLLETSAYYLLGVEPAPEDRDGRPHRVTVRVDRRGAVVRGRAWVVIPS